MIQFVLYALFPLVLKLFLSVVAFFFFGHPVMDTKSPKIIVKKHIYLVKVTFPPAQSYLGYVQIPLLPMHFVVPFHGVFQSIWLCPNYFTTLLSAYRVCLPFCCAIQFQYWVLKKLPRSLCKKRVHQCSLDGCIETTMHCLWAIFNIKIYLNLFFMSHPSFHHQSTTDDRR